MSRHNNNPTLNDIFQSMSGGGQPIDTNCMTLTRFILAEQRKYPTAVGNLSQLLSSLQSAIKAISAAVRRAGISNLFGAAGKYGGNVLAMDSRT